MLDERPSDVRIGLGIEEFASEIVQRRERPLAPLPRGDVPTANQRRSLLDRNAFRVDQQGVFLAGLIDRRPFDVRDDAPFLEDVGIEGVLAQ